MNDQMVVMRKDKKMTDLAHELTLSHSRERFIMKALEQEERFRHTTSAQNQQLMMTMTSVGASMTAGRQSGGHMLLPSEHSGFSGTPPISYGLYPPSRTPSVPSYGSYPPTHPIPSFQHYQSSRFPMSGSPAAGAHITEVFPPAGGPPAPTPPSANPGMADLNLLNLKLPPPSQ